MSSLTLEENHLSLQQADQFISQYLSFLVANPVERDRLAQKARVVVRNNMHDYGLPTAILLQKILGGILDGIQTNSPSEWDAVSLNRSFGDGSRTLEEMIPSQEMPVDVQAILGLVAGRIDSRSINILTAAARVLPPDKLNLLYDIFGGRGTLRELLDRTILTPTDVRGRKGLQDILNTVGNLPPYARNSYAQYYQFMHGGSHYNSLSSSRAMDLPVVVMLLEEAAIHRVKGASLNEQLRDHMGLDQLVRGGNGVRSILGKTNNPDLILRIPYLHHKWDLEEESIELALIAISNVLYTLPGYEKAEKGGNREEQVRIINQFITGEKSLADYFLNSNPALSLSSLMSNFIDPIGIVGIKKANSPKALLEFYSEKKGLKWFDRSQEPYVQGWRIREVNMWQRGEESAKLAIESIEDVLYTIPDYKKAEQTGNREEQIEIIASFANNIWNLTNYLSSNGLSPLMQGLLDPTGEMGLIARNSPEAVLRFYSQKKGFGWFDESYNARLTIDGKGRVILQKEAYH